MFRDFQLKPYPMFREFSQKSDLLERHTPVLPYTASTPPPPPGHPCNENLLDGMDNGKFRQRKRWTHFTYAWYWRMVGRVPEFVHYTHTCLARRKKLVSGKNLHGHVTWIRVHYWLYPWTHFIISLIKRVQGCSQSDALKWVTWALLIFLLTCTGVQKVRSKKA